MGKADLTMLMGTCMTAAGWATKPRDTVCTLTKRAPNTRAYGKKTNNMVKAMKLGLREQATKASITWARNRAEVNTSGQTALFTKANGRTTRLKDMASTSGLMAESTTVSGVLMTCMDLESISTRMALDMTESTSTTRRKDLVITSGPMAESTKAGGIKANNTVLASTSIQSKRLRDSAFGRMENE